MKRFFCFGKRDFCDVTCHTNCKFWNSKGGKYAEKGELTAKDVIGEYSNLDRLRELIEADCDGRCILLPKDGMIYYLEKDIDGDGKWVSNKPIKDICFKVGWGLVTLSFYLSEVGTKIFFNRQDAEDALRRNKDELH